MTKPDVFLFGDSHIGCLAKGLDQHGVKFAVLMTPNPSWDADLVQPDDVTGIRLLSPAETGRVEKAQEALGLKDLTDPGVPVIASFALTTGMLSAGFWDFPPEKALLDARPGDLSDDIRVRRFSSALHRDLVDYKLATKYKIVRKFVKHTELIMVAQPRFPNWQRRYALEKIIIGDLLNMGAKIFDPALTINDPGTFVIAPHHLEPDGIHANADYGAAVIEAMLSAGVIRKGRTSPDTRDTDLTKSVAHDDGQ